MVKADLTRDYYGDLDLQPGADAADIKKQFKKLALTYHPDRNPGRESEVTAKFQKIQSAHEVLTDYQERAKYDANRSRTNTRSGNPYAGASGVRGNPWSNVSAQYPPPPKPPTARRQAPPKPPPQASAGAQRYKNFETPKQSAYQAAQEGAGARKSTYEAWESMKTKPQSQQPGPGRTWKAPQPPPRGTPQSGREESNARTYPAPPKPRPGYDEFRGDTTPGGSPHMRSHSTNASSRKGFMPNTPGGDEPGAPMGAYFTHRNKPTVAPEPPPRAAPTREAPSPENNTVPDPLRQFREKVNPSMEPRVSTPYATHGGEKLNPFDSANLRRSKSTREPSQRHEANSHVPRNGSPTNLGSPHRSRSFVQRPSTKTHQGYAGPTVEIDSDSSEDDGPQINGNAFGKPRLRARRNGDPPAQGTNQVPGASGHIDHSRKKSKISQFRQWYKENPDQEPPLNGFPPDAPPPRSGQPPSESSSEPSMYANPDFLRPDIKRNSSYSKKLPTVSETISSSKGDYTSPNPDLYGSTSMKYPNLLPNGTLSATTHCGVTGDSVSLTAFEGFQRNIVDQIINKRRTSSSSIPGSTGKSDSHYKNQNQKHSGYCTTSPDTFTKYRDSAEAGSPSKKPRARHLRSFHSYDPTQARSFWNDMDKIRPSTNGDRSSFNFPVNHETFNTTLPRPNGFSNSADNISTNFSTKFSTKDWDGKFEAGGDYFKPDQKVYGVSRSGAQSGSRSRGRSPVKVRTSDAHYMQQPTAQEPTIESPGGTKFSAQEWDDTFKPQTFAPPRTPPVACPPRQALSRKRTGPTPRPNLGGNAAFSNDSETSDEKPFVTSRKTSPTPQVPSPDEMDVDTPPVTNTVPQFEAPAGDPLNINTTSPKRRPAPSQSPTDQEDLKVNFDDLRIQDLIYSIKMPTPPMQPTPLVLQNELPSRAAYEEYKLIFAKYMTDWDLFDTQFMLHLVARKRHNDDLGDDRWSNERRLGVYRQGLREDKAVLSKWAEEKGKHEVAVRELVVLMEKMKDINGERASGERPRKKAH